MTWSLQLRNGDLAIDRDRLNIVTDWQKLIQDLRVRLLTKMGEDLHHPEFGSVLDGGTRPDGVEIDSIIGENNTDLVRSVIEVEVRRVMSEYQKLQGARNRVDHLSYGQKSTTPGEILKGYSVNIAFANTYVVVQISISTGSGEVKRISLPISVN